MTLTCVKCRPDGDGENAVDVAFQPIFDVRTRRVRAYEALVRGPNGESAASVLASVTEATRHRFEQHVRVLAIEKAAVLGIVRTSAALSINISPSAVIDAEKCLGHTVAAANRVGLDTRRIVFEFTEDIRLDVKHARAIVDTYNALGFRTALDDFGAGYAGLVTLADIPTDFVKLDIGLIRGIDTSPERQTIVASLLDMLRGLGRQVAAEGVETTAELATIEALGVEMVQGFYLGRPSLTELQRKPYGTLQAA